MGKEEEEEEEEEEEIQGTNPSHEFLHSSLLLCKKVFSFFFLGAKLFQVLFFLVSGIHENVAKNDSTPPPSCSRYKKKTKKKNWENGGRVK